jgi:hypothetical protein
LRHELSKQPSLEYPPTPPPRERGASARTGETKLDEGENNFRKELLWRKTKSFLVSMLGEDNVSCWFSQLSVHRIDEGCVVMACQSKTAGRYVRNNLDYLQGAWSQILGDCVGVDIIELPPTGVGGLNP